MEELVAPDVVIRNRQVEVLWRRFRTIVTFWLTTQNYRLLKNRIRLLDMFYLKGLEFATKKHSTYNFSLKSNSKGFKVNVSLPKDDITFSMDEEDEMDFFFKNRILFPFFGWDDKVKPNINPSTMVSLQLLIEQTLVSFSLYQELYFSYQHMKDETSETAVIESIPMTSLSVDGKELLRVLRKGRVFIDKDGLEIVENIVPLNNSVNKLHCLENEDSYHTPTKKRKQFQSHQLSPKAPTKPQSASKELATQHTSDHQAAKLPANGSELWTVHHPLVKTMIGSYIDKELWKRANWYDHFTAEKSTSFNDQLMFIEGEVILYTPGSISHWQEFDDDDDDDNDNDDRDEDVYFHDNNNNNSAQKSTTYRKHSCVKDSSGEKFRVKWNGKSCLTECDRETLLAGEKIYDHYYGWLSTRDTTNDHIRMIGTKVAKYFAAPQSESKRRRAENSSHEVILKLYTGEVVKVLPPTAEEGALYKVRWEDYDREDLDEDELQDAHSLYIARCQKNGGF